jgi:predicted DNA-binding protein
MLTIQLPGDAETRLETLAKANGRTSAYYAQEAILDCLEDLEDLQIAEERKFEETVPLEEVMKRYGMEY